MPVPSIDSIIMALVHGVLLGGVFMLSAVGLSLVFGVMRIFNMAHGGVVLLGAYLMLQMERWYPIDPLLYVPVIFALVFCIGLVIQRYPINRLLYGRGTGQQGAFMVFIFTFGLVVFIERLIEAVWSYDYQALQSHYLTPITILGLGVQIGRVLAFVIGIAVALSIALILRTRTGTAIRALAQNSGLASTLGVKVESMSVLVFGLYAGWAALSGSLIMLFTVMQPTVSAQYTLSGFTIVVLGGMGSVPGALIASMIVGILESFTAFFIDPTLVGVVEFAILIGVLVFKSTGIFGRTSL